VRGIGYPLPELEHCDLHWKSDHMRSSELPPKLLRHFYILDLWAFGVKNVIGQSRDHCTLWGQKITPFYFTLPCETKHKFVHNGSNVSFKSHGSYGETRHSNCSKCLLLGLRLQLKLWWLLTTEALLVADHIWIRCCFSSSPSLAGFCMSVSVGVSSFCYILRA